MTPADMDYAHAREMAYLRCLQQLEQEYDRDNTINNYRAALHSAWISWLNAPSD